MPLYQMVLWHAKYNEVTADLARPVTAHRVFECVRPLEHPLIALTIRHKTTYRYNRPIWLNAHRLMLRPRESRELRLLSARLTVMPEAVVTWAHDVFGNAVSTATFQGLTDYLIVDSVTDLELDATAWPVFDVAASAAAYPFSYLSDDRADLGELAIQQYPDPMGRLRLWAEAFVRSRPTDTLSLLKDLSGGITAWVRYQSREDEGTQTPIETLDRGWGSCRDFAVLFVEAARGLGFGARIVSGYLYNPEREAESSTTHAWAEVFVPGAGWITFDPTNRSVGGFNLIPVAVGRGIHQVMPVVGSFNGAIDAFQGLRVDVSVTSTR